MTIATFGFTAASNVLSRAVEASADSFALRITHEPRAFIRFERRIRPHNISDPDPPGVWQILFGDAPDDGRSGSASARLTTPTTLGCRHPMRR